MKHELVKRTLAGMTAIASVAGSMSPALMSVSADETDNNNNTSIISNTTTNDPKNDGNNGGEEPGDQQEQEQEKKEYDSSWSWNEDYSKATLTLVNKANPEDTEEFTVSGEAIQVNAETYKAATFEEDGYAEYTATFIWDEVTYTTEKVATLPKLKHNFNVRWVWDQYKDYAYARIDCTDEGYDDLDVNTEATLITDELVNPDCENDGYRIIHAEVDYEGIKFDSRKSEDENVKTQKIVLPAIGHDWNTPTYVWSAEDADGTRTCTATRTCNNGGHPQTETVKATVDITKAATVDEAGEKVYTAKFENEAFAEQSETVAIPIERKEYAAPVYTWSDDMSTCTGFRECINESATEKDNITETVTTRSEITKEATCTEKGEITYYAEFTNTKDFSMRVEKVETPALGHTYEDTAEWDWDFENKTATATVWCVTGNGDDKHDELFDENNIEVTVDKPATCEEDGLATWTATFELNDKTYTDSQQVVIPATGHTLEPTWFWKVKGEKAVVYLKCKDCSFERAEVADLITKTVPASCTEEGAKIVYAVYIDPETQEEYTMDSDMWYQETIEKLPHNFSTPEYTLSDDKTTVTATRKCQDCDEVETETVEVTYTVTTEPTIHERGKGVYTATFENEAFSFTKEVDIPAIDPAYEDEATYDWQFVDGEWTCTATKKCTNGDDADIVETGTVTSAVTKQASCDHKGETTYTATFTDTRLTPDTKVVDDIEMIPHSFGNPMWSWAPVEGGGYTAKFKSVCSVCGEEKIYESTVTSEPGEGVTIYTATAVVDGVTYTSVMEAKNTVVKTPTVSYEPGDNCVKLTWTEVAGATKYGVVGYQNGTWKLITQGYTTSYVLEGLRTGAEYTVAVVAMLDGEWNMDFSNAITVTPNASKVPVITYEAGDNAVKLTWTAVEGATKYKVIGQASNGKWVEIEGAEGYATSYILKDLKVGTDYTVAVVAMIDGKWNMDVSNAVVVTPKAPAVTVPTNIQVAYSEEFHQMRFTWDAVENAQAYGVSVYLAGKWRVQTSSIPASTTSFTTPKNLKPGSTYKIAIAAKVGGTWDTAGAIKNAVTVTVK